MQTSFTKKYRTTTINKCNSASSSLLYAATSFLRPHHNHPPWQKLPHQLTPPPNSLPSQKVNQHHTLQYKNHHKKQHTSNKKVPQEQKSKNDLSSSPNSRHLPNPPQSTSPLTRPSSLRSTACANYSPNPSAAQGQLLRTLRSIHV